MAEENQTPEWHEQIPEQMRELPFIAKSQSMEEAIDHIKDAAATMGNSIRVPGPQASDEDVAKFRDRVIEKFPDLMPTPDPENDEQIATVLAKLGAPADGKEYALPDIEGFEWGDELAQEIRAHAHAAGMTKRQFKQYAQKLGESMHNRSLSASQAHDEAIGKLKAEWGEAFDSRLTQLSNYLEQTAAPEGLREMVKNGKADPSTLSWLHGLMSKGREPSEALEQEGGQPAAITPVEAQARIQEILNNPDYFTPGPKQKVLMDEMLKMQKLANPQ